MYLKSLEMQGFKSFPDRTKLTFERGTTVIVGPNGSGKSNISDAMRWVLGELSSKNLRGSKMEDIIFGGADSRRAMGFAEVSVTFDNTDAESRLDCPYDEVTVTRRYYRVGESEYYINRQACRLKDVYELFMNTGVGRDGYSIIGQGKIAEIISRKSDERRSVFEDASGIAKFRHRKDETERKLQTTEANMARVEDIFREVEGQVAPLEKEAERAKKALELHETKKKVDVQLWLYDSERLRTAIEQAEEKFRNSGYDLKLVEESIADYNAQNDRLFEEAQRNSVGAAEMLEKIRLLTTENHERDNQYKVAETNIANSRDRIENTKSGIGRLGNQLQSEVQEGDRRKRDIAALDARQTAIEAEHAAAEKRVFELSQRAQSIADEMATAFSDISSWEKEALDAKVRIQVLENNKITDSDKNESMAAEIARYRTVSEKLAAECTEKEKSANGYRDGMTQADRQLESLSRRLEEKENQLADLGEQESECKLASDLARQRRDAFRAMEEHFEGYANSVRFVMEAYASGRITDRNGARCGKIHGPLSKLISVPSEYITAIEVALGANLQNIVVEDESVAKAAMYALQRAQAGRATFFPISTMRGQTATEEMRQAAGCAGYVGVASSLLQCDSRFREIVSSLLGRTVICDNIDHASEMARSTRFRVRIVTLDGQVINTGGSFTGGSVKQKAGVLSRAGEISALEEKLKVLSAQAGEYREKRTELEKEREALATEREELSNRRELLSALQNSEAAEAAQLRAKWEANESLIEKLNADFETLNRLRAGYDEELQKLSAREKELRLRIGEVNDFRAEKDVERNGVLDEKTAAEAEVTRLYIEISGLQKDKETAMAFLTESENRAAGLRRDIEADQEKIAGLEKAIQTETLRMQANRNTFDEGERVLRELNEKHDRLTRGNLELEGRRAAVGERLKEKLAEKETVFQAHTKNENRLNSLREEQDQLASKFWEDYEMTRNDALALGYEALTAEGRAEAVALQTNCRNRLRAIGNVDLDAVNKYKEVKERYDYLAGQIADMTAARDDLRKIIRDLEGEMKNSFVSTFDLINRNFNKTFAELFGGGNAEVILTDPENVLESGIEIKAAPPGKIIKSLAQLSGGEQSFVAIALFFAILQVNPTPFFILDEIEAALDDVNVARFAAYIKRYSMDTQFILITHRRGTMEAANRLYGVTMPEHGISKVLALDISSVSGKQGGEDWNGILG